MSTRAIARGAAERVLGLLPRRTRAGDRLILSYHNVVEPRWAQRGDRSLHLPIDQFERQLRLIRTEADIVPLMELLTTEAPRDRRVAITFDDAYGSALRLGVAACVMADAPCTVFVAPALLGQVPPWDRLAESGAWSETDRERFLWNDRGRSNDEPQRLEPDIEAALTIASLEELSVLRGRPLISLGNHSMHHGNLGALSVEEARADVDEAAAWLRGFATDQYLPILAYPYGIAPRQADRFAMSAQFGLMVRGGWFRDLTASRSWAVPRWNVPAGISENGFRLRLRGRLAG